VLGLLFHFQKHFREERVRVAGASKVKGGLKGALPLILDCVQKHADVLLSKPPLVVKVGKISREIAHPSRLQSLMPVKNAGRLVPLLKDREAMSEQACDALLDAARLQLESHAHHTFVCLRGGLVTVRGS